MAIVVSNNCPKCKGQLDEGYIANIPVYGTLLKALNSRMKWVPGKAEQNTMGYVKYPRDGVKPVKTFRCASCGYLESYA